MDDTNSSDTTLPGPGEYVAVEIPLLGTDDGRAIVAVKREIAEDPEQRAAMIASVTETVRKVFPEAAVGEQQEARSGEAQRRLRVVPQDGDHDDVS